LRQFPTSAAGAAADKLRHSSRATATTTS